MIWLTVAARWDKMFWLAEVAQLVEQRTENPRVPSSILGLGTVSYDNQ